MSSLARKLADLIDSGGDVKQTHLDHAVVDLSGYYSKSETDGKIVTLSPPTDLTGYYTKTQVDTELSNLTSTLTALNTAVQGNVNAVNTSLTAYVDTKISALIGNTPTSMDTLSEIADALGDDPLYAENLNIQSMQTLSAIIDLQAKYIAANP